jgi:hypothetical protein
MEGLDNQTFMVRNWADGNTTKAQHDGTVPRQGCAGREAAPALPITRCRLADEASRVRRPQLSYQEPDRLIIQQSR